jgi:hypothetical protein
VIEDVKSAEVGRSIAAAFDAFRKQEEVLRAEYRGRVDQGALAAADALLERATRRFLIDPVLRTLGWDPDDPRQIAEEARSLTSSNERLYFDYLGKAVVSQLPVLLVEAKRFDVDFVRRAGGPTLSKEEAAISIAEALGALKDGREGSLLANWTEWLGDLCKYVRSLPPEARQTLRRVVLTAGRWMVVFTDPTPAFLDNGTPNPASIHCFTSLEEFEERPRDLYRLLDRERLVDTLPITMPLAEALALIQPASMTAYWRGIVIVTSHSGGVRARYPTRSVYPAIIVEAARRYFGIVSYGEPVLEEPREEGEFDNFLRDLDAVSAEFEEDVLRNFARHDLPRKALKDFAARPALGVSTPPEQGSTVALAGVQTGRGFVRSTGEPMARDEYLVVTGTARFHKLRASSECQFHDWRNAREAGKSAPQGRFGILINSYTESGQARHCEHNPFVFGTRRHRCEVTPIETHLCCRSCVYEDVCWATDGNRRPCPL